MPISARCSDISASWTNRPRFLPGLWSCGPTCLTGNPACSCTAFPGAGCAQYCSGPSCRCVVQGAYYWSSTTHYRTGLTQGGLAALGVEFQDGLVATSHKYTALHVRAVRGGQ